METLRKTYSEYKQTIIFVIAATFFWGLLAHSYCFFEYGFSHDSLKELHGAIYGNDWKISLGRVFVPAYRQIFRSDVTLPWLIGVLSLFWISVSVFLTARILDIRSKLLLFLTAGIFTTNLTVSATAATFLHDLDCNMFSLLCAVAAVYCWKYYKRGIVPGALLLTVSLGLYQAFLCVAIVYVMFVCIMRLLEEECFSTVFRDGLRAVGMIVLGGILYLLAMKAIQAVSAVSMLTNSYNSLDQMTQITLKDLPVLIIQSYVNCVKRLLLAPNAYPRVITMGTIALLALISAAALFSGLRNQRIGIREKLLCVLLVILMPLGMNLIFILMRGESVHYLVLFAIWLCYLFALLLCQWLVKQIAQKNCNGKHPFHKWIWYTAAFLVALTLYGNVQFANGMYLKKDLEQDAYISYMTRVLGRVESSEEYIAGETPLCFVGLTQNLSAPQGFDEYSSPVGMWSADIVYINNLERFQNMFGYLLGSPVVLADEATWEELQENTVVLDMPCYPEEGCIKTVEDILIVKLGE